MTVYVFNAAPNTAEDVVLEADQLGYSTAAGFKKGDGATAWSSLTPIATATGLAVLQAATAAAARTATGAQQAFIAAPSTAASTGTTGQIAYDATHIYVCVATNTWVRATLATW